MIRWFIVWLVAFTLRRGVCETHTFEALTRAFPHQDGQWRMAVLSDAQARNARRGARVG